MTERDSARPERGAIRVLEVLASTDRARPGRLQHEFLRAFSSDGWTIDDFKPSTDFAYEAGWIGLDANFYCLTNEGKKKIMKWEGGD